MRAVIRRLAGLAPALAFVLSVLAVSEHAHACRLTGVTALTFGVYDPSRGNLDTTGTVSILCSSSTSGAFTVDISQDSFGSFSPRRLVSGAYKLDYNVYRDAARTLIWGDGSAGTVRYGPTNPVANVTINLTMFGRVPGNQFVAPADYAGTLTVTLTY